MKRYCSCNDAPNPSKNTMLTTTKNAKPSLVNLFSRVFWRDYWNDTHDAYTHALIIHVEEQYCLGIHLQWPFGLLFYLWKTSRWNKIAGWQDVSRVLQFHRPAHLITEPPYNFQIWYQLKISHHQPGVYDLALVCSSI